MPYINNKPLPKWLYTSQIPGKYHLAHLASDEQVLQLKKKKIIIDWKIFVFLSGINTNDSNDDNDSNDGSDSDIDFNQKILLAFYDVIKLLTAAKFDCYLYSPYNSLKKFTGIEDQDFNEDNVYIIDTDLFSHDNEFNSDNMWKIIYATINEVQKNCVAIGCSGKATQQEVEKLLQLFTEISGINFNELNLINGMEVSNSVCMEYIYSKLPKTIAISDKDHLNKQQFIENIFSVTVKNQVTSSYKSIDDKFLVDKLVLLIKLAFSEHVKVIELLKLNLENIKNNIFKSNNHLEDPALSKSIVVNILLQAIFLSSQYFPYKNRQELFNEYGLAFLAFHDKEKLISHLDLLYQANSNFFYDNGKKIWLTMFNQKQYFSMKILQEILIENRLPKLHLMSINYLKINKTHSENFKFIKLSIQKPELSIRELLFTVNKLITYRDFLSEITDGLVIDFFLDFFHIGHENLTPKVAQIVLDKIECKIINILLYGIVLFKLTHDINFYINPTKKQQYCFFIQDIEKKINGIKLENDIDIKILLNSYKDKIKYITSSLANKNQSKAKPSSISSSLLFSAHRVTSVDNINKQLGRKNSHLGKVQVKCFFKCCQANQIVSAVPLWITNLMRMAVANIGYFDNGKFIESLVDTFYPMPVTEVNSTDSNYYQLNCDVKQLELRTIVDKQDNIYQYYWLPISHPNIQVSICQSGQVYRDNYGRIFLATDHIDQCKLQLVMPVNDPGHIISESNYADYYVQNQKSKFADEIINYFSSHYQQDNTNHTSCLARVYELFETNATIRQYCFVAYNGLHAFLLVKDTDNLLLIDLGGIPVHFVFDQQQEINASAHEAHAEDTAIVVTKQQEKLTSTTIEHPISKTIDQIDKSKPYFDRCLDVFAQQFTKKFNQFHRDTLDLKLLDQAAFTVPGTYCLAGDIVNSLQILSDIFNHNHQQWHYYSDVQDFITLQASHCDQAIHIINLDPWYIVDKGEKDLLRLKLHEPLLTLSDSKIIILLINHISSITQDASFVSRIKYFYQVPIQKVHQTTDILQQNDTVNTTILSSEQQPMPNKINTILKKIQAFAASAQEPTNQLTLPILYHPNEDHQWTLLQNIVREFELTGVLSIAHHSHRFKAGAYQIDLKKCDLPALPVAHIIQASSDLVASNSCLSFVLTPSLAEYTVLPFIHSTKHEPTVSVLSLQIVMPLAQTLWYRLLLAAQKQDIQLIISSSDFALIPVEIPFNNAKYQQPSSTIIQSALPAETAKKYGEPDVIISINTIQSAKDLLYSNQSDLIGKIIEKLVNKQKVVIYADRDIDEYGDLQQLLLPLVHGYVLGIDGAYLSFDTALLILIISSNDKLSLSIFSDLPIITNQFDAQESVSSIISTTTQSLISNKHTKQHQFYAEFDQEGLPLPSFDAQAFVLPTTISLERQQYINKLWQFIHSVKAKQNGLASILLEGPSSIGKTTLVKQMLLKLDYQLITADKLSAYEKYTNRLTGFLYNNNAEILPDLLAHIKQYQQILIIDELNSLSETAQDIIADFISINDLSAGFCLIGTLNQGYYPGRQSLMTTIRENSEQLLFEAYSLAEYKEILAEQYLSDKLVFNKQFTTQVIEKLLARLPTTDAMIRLFNNVMASFLTELQALFAVWSTDDGTVKAITTELFINMLRCGTKDFSLLTFDFAQTVLNNQLFSEHNLSLTALSDINFNQAVFYSELSCQQLAIEGVNFNNISISYHSPRLRILYDKCYLSKSSFAIPLSGLGSINFTNCIIHSFDFTFHSYHYGHSSFRLIIFENCYLGQITFIDNDDCNPGYIKFINCHLDGVNLSAYKGEIIFEQCNIEADDICLPKITDPTSTDQMKLKFDLMTARQFSNQLQIDLIEAIKAKYKKNILINRKISSNSTRFFNTIRFITGTTHYSIHKNQIFTQDATLISVIQQLATLAKISKNPYDASVLTLNYLNHENFDGLLSDQPTNSNTVISHGSG